MLNFKRHEGESPAKIVLYTLSTCGWCKKTKSVLDELGVGYDYLDLDLLKGEERTVAKQELAKWNERCSFPTMVINDSECIVGYKEDRLREVLGK